MAARAGTGADHRSHFFASQRAWLRRVFLAGVQRLQDEGRGLFELLFQIEVGNAIESGYQRNAALVHDAFHSVPQVKPDSVLLLDGEFTQVDELHFSASSSSASARSPDAIRAAIDSWQVTQYLAHGTASRRLALIGSSHSRQMPYISVSMRCSASLISRRCFMSIVLRLRKIHSS